MLYFITENDCYEFVKIGYTDNLVARLAALQSSNPREIILLGTKEGLIEDEKELHIKFNHLRVRGEWFKYNEELRNYLRKLLNTSKNIKEVVNEIDKEICLDLIKMSDTKIVMYLKLLTGVCRIIKTSKYYLLPDEYIRLVTLYKSVR